MIGISWQTQRIEAHERFIEAAKKQVAETEEQLHALMLEREKGHSNDTAIAITEQLLKTNQGILGEMQAHSNYMREQFAYLNSLAERREEKS